MDKLKIAKVKDVQCIRDGGTTYQGTLHLTLYHLIFAFTKTVDDVSETKEDWITYHVIAHCTFRPTPIESKIPSTIRVRTRDFTWRTFNFKNPIQARDVYNTIRAHTCLTRIDKLYAFAFQGNPLEKKFNGWDIYDPRAEWKRQGISEKDTDKGWRISTINSDYQFSPTYPALLVLPSSISDNIVNYAGKYRSKVRIPALTYLHSVNNCSITRSSQPMVGLRNHRSAQDEKLVEACFGVVNNPLDNSSSPSKTTTSASASMSSLEMITSTESMQATIEQNQDNLITAVASTTPSQVYGSQQQNLIIDARPSINAMANQAGGAGSENMENYKFATKVYLGIDNIHTMRNCLAKVVEAVKDSDLTNLPPNRELLVKSNWLSHIANILDGASVIARQVGLLHSNVLIHCSDGWDRTSQLSALAQIMLDPYYRTFEGFIVLIEKDWLAFGHMFAHRTGHLGSEKWFNVLNDGLAGSAVQPGSHSPGPSTSLGGDTIENVFAGAKRFFSKKPALSDELDSDGEPIPTDELKARSNSKETLAGQEATKPKETSPVFHQFLDCVWQLLYQNPARFEFNEYFLKRLLYHTYSCQYGTFLYNSEKARVDANVKTRTKSVWDFFLSRRQLFINEKWDGGIVEDYERGHERIIFPVFTEVRWWNGAFGRTNAEMNNYLDAAKTVNAYPAQSSANGEVGAVTGVEAAGVATHGTVHKTLHGDLRSSTPMKATLHATPTKSRMTDGSSESGRGIETGDRKGHRAMEPNFQALTLEQ